MKEIYTEKLDREETVPASMEEHVVDSYLARVPQDAVTGFDSTGGEMPPCSYTDEEILDMLKETEEENLFIPDSLVRKMFV